MRKRKEPADSRQAEIDAGLAEIAAWETWFTTAHAQRLHDEGVHGDDHARAMAPITALAAAVTAKRRADWLIYRGHQS